MNLLIRNARKHDKAAFQQLMEQEGKSMYKVAKAILKNDEDVADAMQETVLTCWEKIDTLKKDHYFRTWLIRILINHCNAIYRQRTRMIPEETIQETWFQETGYADVEWKSFLNGLEEKYRIPVFLYYSQQFSTEQIGKILKLPQGTVKSRLYKARKLLKKELEVVFNER